MATPDPSPAPAHAAPRPDIRGRDDLKHLVDVFYAKVRADPLLGPIFDDVARVNWEVHLPHLVSFWQTVLFGNGGFRGNPMAAHLRLARLTEMDWPRFERWTTLFSQTVNALFQGDQATRIQMAAREMARAFHSRIRLFAGEEAASRPLPH